MKLTALDTGGDSVMNVLGSRQMKRPGRVDRPLMSNSLGGNEIEDAGAKALAEALTTNTTLAYLE